MTIRLTVHGRAFAPDAGSNQLCDDLELTQSQVDCAIRLLCDTEI